MNEIKPPCSQSMSFTLGGFNLALYIYIVKLCVYG